MRAESSSGHKRVSSPRSDPHGQFRATWSVPVPQGWATFRQFARHLMCATLVPVGRYEELRLRIVQGKSDANINFDELRQLLLWLGFDERTRGSHHIFRRQSVRELINLQREGSKAKVYQVRQVR